ncbi:MAG: hypothetical protein ABJG78_10925 [Cyclobacteriaceae bacterium]
MNITDLHTNDKSISTSPLFKDGQGTAVTLRILQGNRLKEHVTKTPALLICLEGMALFENEKGDKSTLVSGDYIYIEPMVKHWVDGVTDSQLLLFK